MLLSDEKYGRQHDYSCRDHYHATEYELFLKPNHRLDRKSSRGMIYENEELRLRTININAEIERGQYDIKKLKRENELLKKEIWCLRDEYEKLDKLLKEKDIDFSSSSTTTSDSESCSSCTDESDDVEKCQNMENVQKINMKNLNRNFEALSVVPEESTENSDKTSNRTSLVNEQTPNDNDVIQADQSYPTYDQTVKVASGVQNPTANLFTSERLTSKQPPPSPSTPTIYPNEYYNDTTDRNTTLCNGHDENLGTYTSKRIVSTDSSNVYQNIVLVPKLRSYSESETLEKTGTDVLVKMDNKSFDSTHEPNGEGDGYSAQFRDDFPRYDANFGRNSHSTFSNGGNLEELLNDIETISQDILAISNLNQNDYFNSTRRCKSDINPIDNQSNSCSEKPFKSELNVTLMPQPMPLIGLEKYRDIHRSMNTTPSKSLENLSSQEYVFHNQDDNLRDNRELQHFQQSSTEISDFIPAHMSVSNDSASPKIMQYPNFPAYLDNFKDNYVNGNYFARYNPENFPKAEKDRNVTNANQNDQKLGKPKLLVKQVSVDVPSSENEENSKLRLKTQAENEISAQSTEETEKSEPKQKVGLRKKVSIHFRGKKEKQKKAQELATKKKNSPVRDKKLQDIKLEESKNDKLKISHQKTSSKDSESDTKNNTETRKTVEKTENDKKQRKSASVSPDRRKINDRKNKKHKKDRSKQRRATVTSLESRDHRARSHSVATDRSNTYGGSHLFFDEYMLNSERDSMSSCETLKTRQMNFSNIPVGGKVPWCGCWGNGCL